MKTRTTLLVMTLALTAACTVTPDPVVPNASNIVEPIQQANAVSGKVELTQAMQVAMTWYAQNGSFSGFNAAAAKAQEPSLTYNDATVAVPGQISVRVVSPTAVVLATTDTSGAAACSAFDGSTGAVSSGSSDATTVEACS